MNDIGFPELKHIKYSTVVDRCIAYLGCTHGSVLDWKTAFKQIPMHFSQWSLHSYDFQKRTYIPSSCQFGFYLLPCTFIKFSQTAKLNLTTFQPDLFTSTLTHTIQHTFDFPRIMLRPDHWLYTNSTNRQKLLQNKAIDRIDVLMDDESWANVSKTLCQLMDSSVLLQNLKYNIESKKSKGVFSQTKFVCCGVLFNLTDQMLTYTDEKFAKWHKAGTTFQSLLLAQATCNIKVLESLAGGYIIGTHMKIKHLDIILSKNSKAELQKSFKQIFAFFEDYSKLWTNPDNRWFLTNLTDEFTQLTHTNILTYQNKFTKLISLIHELSELWNTVYFNSSIFH